MSTTRQVTGRFLKHLYLIVANKRTLWNFREHNLKKYKTAELKHANIH
jgi:hypothetical protein